MRQDRRLNICVALMAALSTLMLGTSQDSVALPIAALTVAATSLLFTDYLGWFSLHRFVAGAAGMVAGANAFIQSQGGGLETQFISVANLLIHLQMILLFQKKTTRIFWQLITLSLLQVVVAAALNLFVLFGPLLVMYTGIAICALLLFFVRRETEPFLDSGEQAAITPDRSLQVHATRSLSVSPQVRKRRAIIGSDFFRHFAFLSTSTLVVSACVFLFMPRFGDGVWRSKTTKAQTGFSNVMNLADSVSIYEDPTVVMRVSFSDEATKEPYLVSGYPYFRGGVKEEYEQGSWTPRLGAAYEKKLMSELESPQRVLSAVRQTVHLETKRNDVVFTVAPACALNDATDSMRVKLRTYEVRYFPDRNDDPVEYSVGTLGFRNGLQSDFVPMRSALTPDEGRRALDVQRNLQALTARATEIVANIPEDQVLRRARALEQHFTNGQEGYQYSLDPSPDRDPRRWPDPVEDFVMNHQSGHCQFFASALALMLRSQNIPARIVQGYRADSYNIVGGYYQLRQMDAHAWVEAAIPADQIPTDEILPTEGMDEPLGAWVRLDPTPGDQWSSQAVAVSAWRQQLADTLDYMQLLWSEYVLGLNEKRQRKAIYEPIKQAFKDMFSREVWAARWQALRARFRDDLVTQDNVRETVIAIAVLTLAFFVLRSAARTFWRVLIGRLRKQMRRRGPRIEFYRRFEKLMGKYGVRRSDNQTPREFAVTAAEQLERTVSDQSVAKIPEKIVDLFYRVRFGADHLDNADVQQLESWLGTLQQSLSKRNGAAPKLASS